MNQELDEVRELTAVERLACNVTSAGIVLLAGVFLLLCGVNVIPVKVSVALCGTLLFAVGLMFLCNALISRNSVSLWLSFCFLVPALVELLVKTTRAGYAELYPLYIAIPAAASLFTMLFTHAWAAHLWVIALFGIPAGIFALSSGGVAGWSVVIPVLVLYVGCILLVLALRGKKKDDKDEF